MERAGPGLGALSEELIEIPHLGPGVATERFVELAMAEGFTVVAAGPNRFRLARVARPRWATVLAICTAVLAGIGLLFLLVKRTYTGEAVVSESRSGVHLRLTGALPPELVGKLRAALAGDEPARQAPLHAASFAPSADHVSSAPAIEIPPLISADAAVDATIPRGSRLLPPPVAVAPSVAASLVLPDGRSIDATSSVVIGRDPVPDPLNPAARLFAVPEPSLSKTHLSFGPLPRGVWVVDHHSTNGTSFEANGVRRECTPGERVEVPFGAKLIAGDVTLIVSPI